MFTLQIVNFGLINNFFYQPGLSSLLCCAVSGPAASVSCWCRGTGSSGYRDLEDSSPYKTNTELIAVKRKRRQKNIPSPTYRSTVRIEVRAKKMIFINYIFYPALKTFRLTCKMHMD